MRKIFSLVLILFGLLSIAAPVFACEPPPPPTPKYLSCNDLGNGYQYGFRTASARNGTYTFDANHGTLTGGAPQDKNNNVKISNSNSYSFDWSASLGIDAVIIQAGGKSTVKKLSEQKSGRHYNALDSRGKPYWVDKVEFCYDYALHALTTAQGNAASSIAWEINKTAATAEQAKFAGEKATFDYTVAVKKTAGGNSSYSVDSKVTVQNNTPLPATITSIKEIFAPGKTEATLDCGKIKFPYTLPAGKEFTCTATTPLSSRLDGESQVDVKTRGKVGGDSASAKINWSGAPGGPTGPGTITVTDTNPAFGGPYTVSADQSWTYSVELACPTDPAAYTNGQQTTTLKNTAAITETGQNATQDVTLHCYAPSISTTANAGYDVQYTWGVTKTSPVKNLTLDIGKTANVDYTVVVSVVNQTETNFKLSGTVTISNPHPSAPLTAALTDEIAPGVPAAFSDCTSPITVPAAGTLTCNYQARVDSKPAGANTATVSFNAIAFTAAAPYDFGSAVKNNEVDECATVTDDPYGPLGTVCADKAPVTFNYSMAVGPYSKCQTTSRVNTASFVTNDTAAEGYANWEVMIKVPCPPPTGCTYNEAYWKAHADPNSADYAATWNKIQPSGPTSPFFTTGSTWIATLQNNTAGNTYLPLARAYIATQLNILYGTAAPAPTQTAFDHAAALLAQYATSQGSVTGDVAKDFAATADTLTNFNTGLTGPGLCPDCNQ